MRCRHVMQPEHRGQITSWVAPARQQCSTFPLSTTVRRQTAYAPGLRASLHPKVFQNFTCCLPVIMLCVYMCVYASVRILSWISPDKMPFVVEERWKKNIVPVRLLSRVRLVCISVACVIGNLESFTRCLAVISMRNLASERTLVYIFPGIRCALKYLTDAVYTSSWF